MLEMMFSKTARIVENAAKLRNRKNSAPPETAQGHGGEDIGQGHEDQSRSGGGFHAVGKAGRDHDQRGGQRHEGIQHRYVQGFAEKPAVLADVGTEDGHGADAKGQGEKCLVHGGGYHAAKSDFTGAGDVRDEEIAHTFCGAGGEQGVGGENHHDDQQSTHHPLCGFFQTRLEASGTDAEAGDDHQDGKQNQASGV